jgi:hypothetical protein
MKSCKKGAKYELEQFNHHIRAHCISGTGSQIEGQKLRTGPESSTIWKDRKAEEGTL